MKYAVLIALIFLFSCKNNIDENNVEMRNHGLSYLKGTNKLVDGKVVRKADGTVIESQTYKNGEAIGKWFLYSDKGTVLSHGFGTEIKDYEKILNGLSLSYCILSIAEVETSFSYATLYMDNEKVFSDTEKILDLAKAIFKDYSVKYKIDELLIFDKTHEYTILKSVCSSTKIIIDTIPDEKIITCTFR